MASKVMISLPPTAASFQNVVQNNLERKQELVRMTSGVENTSNMMTSASGSSGSGSCVSSKDSLLRVDELEKTIKFLKDEQKRMLNNLHQEIASLQAKNRDLLCQLIFNTENGLDYQNSISDSDVKYILMTNEASKKPIVVSTLENKEISGLINGNGSGSAVRMGEIYELKYTIDQQQREIDYLKGQLELVSVRNKTQARESRQVDNYIREMENRNRDQEKVIRLLRKENKDHKIEIDNLRKTVSNLRMPNHNQMAQNVQIAHVQPQAQLFPAVGTPSTFWYQNRPIPMTEYHQMQRTSMSANGGDRSAAGNMTNVQFTLPPVCNYRQIAVTAPLPSPPRFYSNTAVPTTATGCYYSVAPRPMLRNKTYLSHSESGPGDSNGNASSVTGIPHRAPSTNMTSSSGSNV